MKPSPIIQSAWSLLDLILQEEPPNDTALAQALDELALAAYDIPPGSAAETDREPPPRDQTTMRAIIEARFPDYGWYATVLDPLVLPGDPGTGDAIDDLLDIAGDLAEAVWRADHLGADDAHWFLHLMQLHWGRHMRDLSLYLHARRFR